MTERDQIARLVLDCSDGAVSYASGVYTWQIDLGNFATNITDLVYLELDYVTPLFMCSTAANVINDNRSIELLLDVPHFNSYDSSTQSQTNHLCVLDRDTSLIAATNYAPVAGSSTGNSDLPTTWQAWRYSHRPQRIPVRPEVLQQKRWSVVMQFVAQNSGTVVDTDAKYMITTQPKLVLSITK